MTIEVMIDVRSNNRLPLVLSVYILFQKVLSHSFTSLTDETTCIHLQHDETELFLLILFFLSSQTQKHQSNTSSHFFDFLIEKNEYFIMSNNAANRIKEKVDYIYQRLRTQLTNLGFSQGSHTHVFYVFGASVCFSSVFFFIDCVELNCLL